MIFEMGKYQAEIPDELLWCRNHMWCRSGTDGLLRFGFGSYAMKLMRDVYFLEWSLSDDSEVAPKQAIGNIESSKAQSELYSPLAGRITKFNEEVLGDPSVINASNDGDGWLFEMEADAGNLMDANGYCDYLTRNWETTQKILKGQI